MNIIPVSPARLGAVRFRIPLALVLLSLHTHTSAADVSLLNLAEETALKQSAATDATVTVSGSALRVTTGHAAPWPGITMKAPEKAWDLSACGQVAVRLKNTGTAPCLRTVSLCFLAYSVKMALSVG